MQSIYELSAEIREGELTPELLDKLRERLYGKPAAVDEFVLECFLTDQLVEQLGTSRMRRKVLAQLNSSALDEAAAELHKLESSITGLESSHRSTVTPNEKTGLLNVGRFFAQPTPVSMTVAALVISLLITVMAFMAPPFYRAITQESGVSQPDDTPRIADWPGSEIVAKLARTYEVRWAPNTTALRIGDRLQAGSKLELASGRAEIQFAQGGRVLLQGPAEFTMLSDNAGRLASGELSALAERAPGFVVETPLATVTDLGTEFAVRCQQENEVEVHVFDGRVMVAPNAGNAAYTAPAAVQITAGEVRLVRRDADGRTTIHASEARDDMFARIQQHEDPTQDSSPRTLREDFSLGLPDDWFPIRPAGHEVAVQDEKLVFRRTTKGEYDQSRVRLPIDLTGESFRAELDARIISGYDSVDRITIQLFEASAARKYSFSPSPQQNIASISAYRDDTHQENTKVNLPDLGQRFPPAGHWWRMRVELKGAMATCQLDMDRDGNWDVDVGPWEIPPDHQLRPRVVTIGVSGFGGLYEVETDNFVITSLP